MLMYHGLHADAADAGRYDPVYSVAPSDFAAQLAWLAANRYRTVTLAEIGHLEPRERAVVITFDDGDVTNLTVAEPLLARHGFVAEIFVTSDFVGQPGMLTPAQLAALAAAGQRIQSHGKSHAYLASLDDSALAHELRESRRQLAAQAGTEVDALAFPGGRGGAREAARARALGYRHVLGSVPGPNRDRGAEVLERIAVTRAMPLERFAALVRWRGLPVAKLRAKHAALALAKRTLGDRGYEMLRAKVLGR